MNIMRDYKFNSTWLNSNVGQDIIYYASLNKAPAIDCNMKYYSLLEASRRIRGGLYRAQSYYNYLSFHFPDSLFLLYEIDNDSFISNQYSTGYIKDIAFHYNLSENETINKLLRERAHHIALVKNYFSNNNRFLNLSYSNDSRSLKKINEFLKSHDQVEDSELIRHCSFNVHAKGVDNSIEKKFSKNTNQYIKPSLTYDSFNSIVSKLVNHCVKDRSYNVGRNVKYGVSVSWNPVSGTISHSKAIIRSLDGKYITNSQYNWKMRRVAGVLNDLEYYGCRSKVVIDMQDARLYGIDGDIPLSDRVIAYCCREGAKNIILWPLPGYHSIGFSNFPGGFTPDTLSYNEKKSIAVWRGALSGPCSDVVNGEYNKAAHIIIQQLLSKLSDNESIEQHINILLKNIRASFVNDFVESPKIDAGIVLGRDQIKLNKTPLKRIIANRLTHTEMYSYKFIVCLRGFDTASNFLMAASSNSVALKEEDGWEVFYSCLFEPWVHYIPLAPGGKDVIEKIKWAENNQEKVIQIIANANYACSLLSRKDIRDAMCLGIVNKLNLSNI
ncbi:hypothetical protein E0X81_11870 [Halomonas sp. GDM18]|nr:hypothetical protein E0X81_11870 [Halomonas sp. GDM18]